jgi:hypothetical protein
MSVNPTIPKERNHSTSELRFLEFEAGYVKKHEELLKTVENLTRQLNEVKAKQVRIFFVSKLVFKLRLD